MTEGERWELSIQNTMGWKARERQREAAARRQRLTERRFKIVGLCLTCLAIGAVLADFAAHWNDTELTTAQAYSRHKGGKGR